MVKNPTDDYPLAESENSGSAQAPLDFSDFEATEDWVPQPAVKGRRQRSLSRVTVMDIGDEPTTVVTEFLPVEDPTGEAHLAAELKKAPKGAVPRIAGIDIARGIAIYLMIQSHTVKGLMFFRDMPDWGVMPMHTLTKISSSLFVLVFGVTLGVIFLPRTLTDKWYKTRNHLWFRALVVTFWYKVLILVQTFQTRDSQVIIDMLLYRRFPDFVEILNFYSWILLVIPVLLPLWRKMPIWAGLLMTGGLVLLGQLLAAHWDFFGLVQVKAIVVEAPGNFCYGLLTRGPLALFGVFLGDLIGRADNFHIRRRQVVYFCLALGTALLVTFFSLYHQEVVKVLTDIARNRGKHPPQFFFISFSLGGSLILLGVCLLIGKKGPWILKPFELLGRESLVCFVFHICVIFIGLRWLLALKRVNRVPQVTYAQALWLTLAVTLACLGVAMLNTARKRRKRSRQIESKARRQEELAIQRSHEQKLIEELQG